MLAEARAADAPACSRAVALAIGILAAALYLIAAGRHLERPGPQYDELHQATGAFTHLGSPPELFSLLPIRGYPLLNMRYSAAIKTHLYGLYLRAFDRFSLRSWRALGLAFVALGIVAWSLLARRALPWWALAIALALLVTDGTFLVLGRHDYGPIDLALLLRLVLIGLWLHGARTGTPTLGNSFGLGAIVGLAVVEKLSSVALIPGLAAMLVLTRSADRVRHLIAAAAGGVAFGAVPLALINVLSFDRYGALASIPAPGPSAEVSIAGFLEHLASVFAVGGGERAAALVLGTTPAATEEWEAMLLAGSLVAALTVALLARSTAACYARAAALAYLAVVAALYLLPRATSAHHWVIGTPFQYVAVALGAAAIRGHDAVATPLVRRARPWAGGVLLALLALWIAARAPVWLGLQHDIAMGRSSPSFDPALATLGRFAAAHVDDSIFVASDWGVATQIYCYSNGRPAFVHETFWDDIDADRVDRIQHASGTEMLYLVRPDPPTGIGGEATARIERELASDRRWIEVPIEREVAALGVIAARKFAHRPHLATRP